MPFFEEELRKIMQYSCYNDRIIFFTSMCYVKVGDYIRMRMELEGDGGYHYNGIKMTMVNYREAEVDNYTLWFLDALEADWPHIYGMKEGEGNGTFTSRSQKIIRN